MKIEEYNFPENLLYDIGEPGHIWIKKIEEGIIEIGIDDYASEKAGRIEFVRLMKEQTRVSKNQTIGTYESGKWIGQLKSPISGYIIERNEQLKQNPELLNQDPYGKGWILRIEGKKVEEELSGNENIGPPGDKLVKHIKWRIRNEK